MLSSTHLSSPQIHEHTTQTLVAESIVDSWDTLTKWLKTVGISTQEISRIAVSFMMSIPPHTPVKILKQNGEILLYIGMSRFLLEEHPAVVDSAMHNFQVQVENILRSPEHQLLPSGERAKLERPHMKKIAASHQALLEI